MTVASMIIGTWAECAKRKVEHYYKARREKYEVASNRNNLYSSGSRKLIGKRGAVNEKIDNRTEEIAAAFAEALVVEIVVAIVDADAVVLAAMTKMTVLLSALCSFSLEHGEFLLRHYPKNDAVEEQVEIWTDFDFLSEFGSSKTVVDDAEFPVFFGVPAVKIEFRKLEKLPPDGLK
ncbi:uncharacterized protein E5676_scaffold482G00720 [Cucumis melo var. makuwa]|uniref:Uncharacterized protein n=1 Tax=Cucumis melo var. makuwa TaxID=1194695 RepID=A0A5D3DFG8_CUCMM|nr:uncharacterized protein E5676_scaffold482G00720 [Cucumis melo var. makuwa]